MKRKSIPRKVKIGASVLGIIAGAGVFTEWTDRYPDTSSLALFMVAIGMTIAFSALFLAVYCMFEGISSGGGKD